MSTEAARRRTAAELQNTALRLGRQYGLDADRAWDDLPDHVQECYVAVITDLEDRAVIIVLDTQAELDDAHASHPSAAGVEVRNERIAQIAEEGRRAAWHEDDRL